MPLTGPGPIPQGPIPPGPITPSTAWFWLAAMIAVVGVGAAIAMGVRTAGAWEDRIDGFERVDVPGTGTVTLEEPGVYRLYYEYGSPDDELSFASTDIDVSVVGPDGSEVELDGHDDFVTTYDTSDHAGEVLFSFTAEVAGPHAVTGVPFEAEGSRAFEGRVAVGRGLEGIVVGGVVNVLATGLGGVVVGVIVAVVVAVARGRERRRRRVAVAVAGAGGPPWPPGRAGSPGVAPGRPAGGAPPPPPGGPPGPWPQPPPTPRPPGPANAAPPAPPPSSRPPPGSPFPPSRSP